MKRICTLLMAVLFLSVTAVSAQDATTKSKKEVKKEDKIEQTKQNIENHSQSLELLRSKMNELK